MTKRRSFLLSLTSALVALTVVAVPVIAAELIGVLTKVDVEGKKVMVLPKDADKEVEVTVTDDTEYVTPKGSSKLDLEKLAKSVAKAQDKGAKGISVTITHENAKASKIERTKKKAANPAAGE